jgi:hypothetical protein
MIYMPPLSVLNGLSSGIFNLGQLATQRLRGYFASNPVVMIVLA